MNEAWMDDAKLAASRWRVTFEETGRVLLPPRNPEDAMVRYVEAEAGTGSRYVVVTTPLGPGGRQRESGPVMVTLVQPWQAAYPLFPGGYLDLSYVAEKFKGDWPRSGGDMAAVALTLAHAMGCKPDPLLVSDDADRTDA